MQEEFEILTQNYNKKIKKYDLVNLNKINVSKEGFLNILRNFPIKTDNMREFSPRLITKEQIITRTSEDFYEIEYNYRSENSIFPKTSKSRNTITMTIEEIQNDLRKWDQFKKNIKNKYDRKSIISYVLWILVSFIIIINISPRIAYAIFTFNLYTLYFVIILGCLILAIISLISAINEMIIFRKNLQKIGLNNKPIIQGIFDTYDISNLLIFYLQCGLIGLFPLIFEIPNFRTHGIQGYSTSSYIEQVRPWIIIYIFIIIFIPSYGVLMSRLSNQKIKDSSSEFINNILLTEKKLSKQKRQEYNQLLEDIKNKQLTSISSKKLISSTLTLFVTYFPFFLQLFLLL